MRAIEHARGLLCILACLHTASRIENTTPPRALALSRTPLAEEEAACASLIRDLSKRYEADLPAAARVHPGTAGLPAGAELAAWTVLSSTLLNLDEAITRE